MYKLITWATVIYNGKNNLSGYQKKNKYFFMIEITDIAITNLSKSFNHVLKTYAYFVKQKKKDPMTTLLKRNYSLQERCIFCKLFFPFQQLQRHNTT